MSRRPLVVGVGGAVAVALAWYALLWSPQTTSLAKQQQAAAAAEAKLATTRSAAIRQRAGAKDEPVQRAQLDLLKAAIPDNASVGTFILEANDVAVQSGVTILSIAPRAADPKAPAAAAGLVATPVTITASGTYDQVVGFLARLEHMSRLIVVDGMSATAATGGSKVNVSLAARMFSTKAASS
ncbi:MAG: Tfp pilus assembly protein PilO [Acidimicrobiales bacterium]|jgi:Tfp pilus assembly protein PilO|nr:Tfp pilus assembly protein PilO [Acidimicrobiales bacterium]